MSKRVSCVTLSDINQAIKRVDKWNPGSSKLSFVTHIFQTKKTMTFVNKSPKWVPPPTQDTPGPGSYILNPHKHAHSASSCFLSKTVREDDSVKGLDVGPGSYDLSKIYSTQTHNQPAFKSKLQRFTSKKPEHGGHSKTQMELQLQQLLNFGQRQKGVPGKIVSLNKRKQFSKQIMPQNLPSIPNSECSFGYRYDQDSKKLVQNQNPKILFANVISSTNQDFYFQRTQSYMGKGLRFSIQKKLKRTSPQLAHQVGLPDPSQYQPEVCKNQPKVHIKKMNAHKAFKQRFDQSISQKELLKLQKLRREFKDYIPRDIQLKDLEEAKMNLTTHESQSLARKGNSTQCFMSKMDRFKQRKTVEHKKEDQKIHLKIVEKPSQTENKVGQKSKKKRKQPYGLGQPRFRQKGKENVGPGYYELKPQENTAVTLDQKQQRFKPENIFDDVPGPGSYQASPIKKQKDVIPFNRYICSSGRSKNRYSSMQGLYDEIGKQLNHQAKADRPTKMVKFNGTPEKQVKAYQIYKKDMNRIKDLVQ